MKAYEKLAVFTFIFRVPQSESEIIESQTLGLDKLINDS